MTIPHPLQTEKELVEIAEQTINPESEAALRRNNVTVKRYLTWKIQKSRNISFNFGLGLAFSVGAGIPLVGYFTGKVDSTWAAFFFVIVFPILLLAAFSGKGNMTMISHRYSNLSLTYFIQSLITRSLKPEKIAKISDKEWGKIRDFDVEKYWTKLADTVTPRWERPKIEKFEKIENKLKPWIKIFGIAEAVLFILPMIVLTIAPYSLRSMSDAVFLLYGFLFVIASFGLAISLGGRYFMKGLVGYGKRSIHLHAGRRRGIIHYTGGMATFWSIVLMVGWSSLALLLMGISLGLFLTGLFSER